MIDLKTLRLITQNGLQAFAIGRVLDGIAALRTLLPYCATETIICAEADNLEKNYHYMLSFLRGGGSDERRNEVQAKIQRRGIALLGQASRAIRLSQNSDHYSKTTSAAQSPLDKWNSLLTPEEAGEVQDDLFDLLWTSPLWTAQDTAFWYDFLLRQRDMVQQHLAGAIFLSTWEYYDPEKMQLLGLLADSECHRTRITAAAYLLLLRLRHKELTSLMPPLPESLLSRKGRKLIAQVQHEMLLMLVSEKDMKQEIDEIGELSKTFLSGKPPLNINNLKALIETKGRHLKKRLQRGLDPNLSKAVLLHNCKYLNRISHWFLPFDKTHPLFQSVMIDEKGNEKQNLSALVDLILDCDVDKMATLYLVANDKDFSKAMQKLDDQQLPEIENAIIPEYTFRFLMQDLYRFFVHSPLSQQLANPFRIKQTLFDFPDLAALFSAGDCLGCCHLLLEIGRNEQALAALDDSIKRVGASASALLLKGEVLRREKKFAEAVNCARSAEILEPDNTDILRFLVECYAVLNRFEEELEYLQRLSELLPEDKTLHRLIPITMTKLGRNEEALQLFFKLDYESTEDDKDYEAIVSCIADTALELGKLDIAERYTEKEIQLSEGKKWQAHLRAGHIKLLQDDWKGTLDCYEQFVNTYCEETGKNAKAALKVLDTQWSMINSHNGQRLMEKDFLLIHDILQASAEQGKEQVPPIDKG